MPYGHFPLNCWFLRSGFKTKSWKVDHMDCIWPTSTEKYHICKVSSLRNFSVFPSPIKLFNLVVVLGLHCSSWPSHRGGFSSGSSRAPGHRLIVVAPQLSCPTPSRIFPDQGLNLYPPALAGRSLSTVPPGESQINLFLIIQMKK